MKKRNKLGQFIPEESIWKKCLICKQEFRVCSWNKDRKFCSHQCYWKFSSIHPYPHAFKKGHSLIGKPFKKGHKVPLEWKENLSKCYKGKRHSPKTEFKKGEHRNVKENNPMWNNGSSFEPYSPDWTKSLKKFIRKTDKYTCQYCGKTEEEEKRRLSVHHIDYNKKNCVSSNLITLCNRCNIRVNQNRAFWTTYFQAMVSLRNL